jgi:hypothetical protein
MSRYFLVILLLILNNQVFSQNENNEPQTSPVAEESDTLVSLQPDSFIRVGFDLSAIGRQFFEPEVRQFEFSVDSEVFYNWFAIFEGGFANVRASNRPFDYNAQTYFGRIGADYNLLPRTGTDKNNSLALGIRYAYGLSTHEASDFLIRNAYWGDTQGNLDRTNFHLHWIEFSAGLKTEVFQNFYLGWMIKTRVRIYETQNPDLTPYYLGGYGHEKRRAPVMIHYYMLYKLNFSKQ